MLTATANHRYILNGTLDKQNIELLNALLALSKANSEVIIDFGGLESADSVLLSAVLHLIRELTAKGTQLKLQHFPKRFISLAKTYGIETLIEPYCLS